MPTRPASPTHRASVKIAFRCGTSAMFRLVMNPKMKNSAVTVINGTRYPGDVSAADWFGLCCHRWFAPRFLKKFRPVRALSLTAHMHSGPRLGSPTSWFTPGCTSQSGFPAIFAAHNTIRKTPIRGSDCGRLLMSHHYLPVPASRALPASPTPIRLTRQRSQARCRILKRTQGDDSWPPQR